MKVKTDIKLKIVGVGCILCGIFLIMMLILLPIGPEQMIAVLLAPLFIGAGSFLLVINIDRI